MVNLFFYRKANVKIIILRLFINAYYLKSLKNLMHLVSFQKQLEYEQLILDKI